MDKTFRKLIIGMAVPTVIALAVTIIMTVMQKDIIRSFSRFIIRNPSYRRILGSYIDFTKAGGGTVIPYYMFFCVIMSLVVLTATIIVVSVKAFRRKPGAAVLLFVLYGITPVLGTFYNLAGGDKLLNSPRLSTNVDILSTMISLVVSPVMVISFVFFIITVIRFIIRAKKERQMALQ